MFDLVKVKALFQKVNPSKIFVLDTSVIMELIQTSFHCHVLTSSFLFRYFREQKFFRIFRAEFPL